MDWIGFLIGLLFPLTFAQDDHLYKDMVDTYFAYHIFPYENCESATECPLLRKIIRPESIENIHVCNLNETIRPTCPLPNDDVCICVKDVDCKEIYEILDRKDYDMEEVLNVKNDFQNCGYDDFKPKYCCPYPVKQCNTRKDSPRNANTPCLFPFIYDGKKYHQCADLTVNSKGYENICATKRDDGFEMADFGYCGDECDIDRKY